MTIATTKGFIQAKNATITGLSVAQCPVSWPQTPAQMASLTLPLCLAKKGPGTARKQAGKVFSENEWEIRLFFAEEHQETYTQSLNDADTYEQRLIETYADPDNFVLSYSPTIVEVQSFRADGSGIRSTGLITHTDFFPGLNYYGVTLRIVVTEQEI